jgi:hypothetical protein
MHNWDYPKDTDFKQDPVWYLERMINYGLNGAKLERTMVEQYLPKLNIPDDTRAFSELLLWNKPF